MSRAASLDDGTMSTGRDSDIDVVRGVYEAVGRGDFDAVVAALDEDVEWIEPEGGPSGGTYRGPEAVVNKVFTELGDEWTEFAVEADRFVAVDGTVVALVTRRGSHAETGERVEAPIADVWDLEDGTMTWFQHYVGSVRHAPSRGGR